MVDISKGNACFPKTVPNCFGWKARPVLNTTKAFFFYGLRSSPSLKRHAEASP